MVAVRRTAGWLLAGCVTMGACGCNRDAPGTPDSIEREPSAVAQVDRAVLRGDDLRQLIPQELREGITGAEVAEIVDNWVRTELLYQKAIRDGLDQEPAMAHRMADLRRQVLADEMLQREIRARVRVSNEEVQAYYDANREIYTKEIHIQHILLNTPEEAEDVLQRLSSGGDFKTLAREYSVDASAARGGDLGFLGKGAMNPAFESVVFQMQDGEVYGPLESGFGYHVIKVVGRRNCAQPVSLEESRDEIVQALLLEKQQTAYDAVIAELRKKARVHVASSYAGMPLAREDTSETQP